MKTFSIQFDNRCNIFILKYLQELKSVWKNIQETIQESKLLEKVGKVSSWMCFSSSFIIVFFRNSLILVPKKFLQIAQKNSLIVP